MNRLWIIFSWEISHHLQNTRFWLVTFLSPLLLALMIWVASLYFHANTPQQSQIGYVEFDSTSHFQELTQHLTDSLSDFNSVLLVPINPDTTEQMQQKFAELAELKQELDSLNEAYNKIKERRRYIFQKPDSRSRRNQLSKSYEELLATREQRDLIEIEYTRMKTITDTLVKQAVLKKADSLLAAKEIEGYIVLEKESFKRGIVEFHAAQPINFLHIQPLKQALQVMVVEERMKDEGITVSQIQKLLEPIRIQEILSEGMVKREFKFMVTYLAPVVVIIFLFLALYTSIGFLFNSFASEKVHHILQLLLTHANRFAIIVGKIMGCSVLGFLQIIIWVLLTLILIGIGAFPLEELGFLTVENLGLFLLYYFLGFAFFAMIAAILGISTVSEYDAMRNRQLIRSLLIIPLLLAGFILYSPNSMLVRILSFIPPLSPVFMVLRTPLGQPPLIDYYFSSSVLGISLILGLFLVHRIIKVGSIHRENKTSFKLLMQLLRQQ
ncbi:MAG: hypothetical protein D6748_00850 [Calditrichaeota bacterium]|nr:MAG: hypothetical protein D6748_00850 [Calditrichota bacterium]